MDVVESVLFKYDFWEIYGVVLFDFKMFYDVCEVIVCMVDVFDFDEFKVLYGMFLVCGFV